MREVGLEPKRVQFVTGTTFGAPYLVLVVGVKDVKPQLKILPNYVNGD